ncbi:hypothetical protein SAMN06297382_0066 [Amphiplicatus metriothermophilus]|uniref:Uncharacterized protein n=1 Tax=Amphiplicatus metriothermophilus TaxID=1519374 RepID=A0A239PIG1_9PROT|nr:hypothetical protein [Amphiplicatus metriothermophilus]SNT67576.1 hypothetical protein SAMN06297382_0066 [Amphiplicatus metriothermophilus]
MTTGARGERPVPLSCLRERGEAGALFRSPLSIPHSLFAIRSNPCPPNAAKTFF